jgi:hypothetical protein
MAILGERYGNGNKKKIGAAAALASYSLIYI